MSVKKVLGWAIVIFLGWFIWQNPTGAAHMATNILDGLKSAADSAATFFTSL